MPKNGGFMNAKGFLCAIVFLSFVALSPLLVGAGELDRGLELYADGDLQAAAEFFNNYARDNPGDSKRSPEALAYCGRILDGIADVLTGNAEKGCYWTKGGAASPACMQKFAEQYNLRFGAGAFRYEHAITYIFYTGLHYEAILEKYPKSPYAPEAEFYLLLRGLVGHPDQVLPKIKSFLARHPKGEWNRKGLLLWARVNEDIWFVHRKWSWVLYNSVVAPEELMIRAEKYRKEALATYEKLMKDKRTFEGIQAAREYEMLKDNRDDDKTYGIVNDSTPGTLIKWGIEMPSPNQGGGKEESGKKKK